MQVFVRQVSYDVFYSLVFLYLVGTCIYNSSQLFSHLYQVGSGILSRISYNVPAVLFSVPSGRVSNLVLLCLMGKPGVSMSRPCVCKLVFCTEVGVYF